MAFGGNTRDLGSFREETDEITDLHQILKEVLLIEHGDGIAGIKRCHYDPSSDGVRDLVQTLSLKSLGTTFEVRSTGLHGTATLIEWRDLKSPLFQGNAEEDQWINEKLIEGVVDNNRFNNSLSGARNNFEEELFKDKFPTEEELAYHKELLGEPLPLFSTLEPKIRRGDPWSLKIPCIIGTVYTGHAYIDL
ncbi:hypothetical protein Tco_0084168 [Tanacetum coccineum]